MAVALFMCELRSIVMDQRLFIIPIGQIWQYMKMDTAMHPTIGAKVLLHTGLIKEMCM